MSHLATFRKSGGKTKRNTAQKGQLARRMLNITTKDDQRGFVTKTEQLYYLILVSVLYLNPESTDAEPNLT